MKISLLCSNLSGNALGRVFILVKVLERRYEVEIIGPISDKGIWQPLNNEIVDFKGIKTRPGLGSISVIRLLLSEVTGDVIYACKPVFPSFGIGLMLKRKEKIPLVLDIDDWELGGYFDENLMRRIKLILQINPQRLDGYHPLTWLLYKQIRHADAITVSSRFLKNMYGGVIVPHGRDTDLFNPEKYNPTYNKKMNNLEGKKVVMFYGTPRQRKGIEDLVEAMALLNQPNVVLAIIGVNWNTSLAKKLKHYESENLKLFGVQPFSMTPHFLSMADVVVIPQRKCYFNMGQVPAKLFDAMAMAKPIVATAVSDIPEIIGGQLGIIVEPQNVTELAKGINWVLENANDGKEMGERAREKCIREYSFDAMDDILFRVFKQYASFS